MDKELIKLKKDLRQALADYIASEGCSCCRHHQRHEEAQVRLAKLLNVKKYEDGSGYNFSQYQTKQSGRK